jgi:hypothetical protein
MRLVPIFKKIFTQFPTSDGLYYVEDGGKFGGLPSSGIKTFCP